MEDMWIWEDKQFEFELTKKSRLKLEKAQDEQYDREKAELLQWKINALKDVAGDDLREADIEYEYEQDLDEINF